jgi:hypothetical protein
MKGTGARGSSSSYLVWWRRITANDYYNIEKELKPGPKGQLHVDIPNPSDLLRFLGKTDWIEYSIRAKGLIDQSEEGAIRFRPRPRNSRFDIPMQNLNAEDCERHPSWCPEAGWPTVSPPVASTKEAKVVSDRGLIIFLVRDSFRDNRIGFVYGEAADQLTERIKTSFQKSSGMLDDVSNIEYESLVYAAKISRNPGSHISPNPKGQLGNDKIGGGQGYGLSPESKRAVEKYAVSVAIEELAKRGFDSMEDVGDHESFDISCTLNGRKYFIEVKGTTTEGSKVNLTRNEVLLHSENHPFNALIVVSQIKLESSPDISCTGGKTLFISPWIIEPERLTPLSFDYVVP